MNKNIPCCSGRAGISAVLGRHPAGHQDDSLRRLRCHQPQQGTQVRCCTGAGRLNQVRSATSLCCPPVIAIEISVVRLLLTASCNTSMYRAAESHTYQTALGMSTPALILVPRLNIQFGYRDYRECKRLLRCCGDDMCDLPPAALRPTAG